jgi:hypothetical protein
MNDERREFLRRAGKVAIVTPPTLAVLLKTEGHHYALALSGGGSNGGGGGSFTRGNNGVGNGIDPQPRGNPPVNDGPGTGPGNPGNRGGANR